MDSLDRNWAQSLPRPYLIAGPCSAESRPQLLSVAKELSGQIHVLRAGLWKPRTRPGHFEGAGQEALGWFDEASKSYELPLATEVAKSDHLLLAKERGITTFWIGARTTVNPFAVQELANIFASMTEVERSKFSVFVKNPLVPDLSLWVGAIERFLRAGVKRVGAIHRGFQEHIPHVRYRNRPLWSLALELKSRMPELPLLCDPSHMGGRSEYIFEISQKALSLGLDGLMIETHPNPQEALSDPLQQVTPKNFKMMMNVLRETEQERQRRTQDPQLTQIIYELRESIDQLDEDLLENLSKRKVLAQRIGACKEQVGMRSLQLQRFQAMLDERLQISRRLELDSSFVSDLFYRIHKESLREQIGGD